MRLLDPPLRCGGRLLLRRLLLCFQQRPPVLCIRLLQEVPLALALLVRRRRRARCTPLLRQCGNALLRGARRGMEAGEGRVREAGARKGRTTEVTLVKGGLWAPGSQQGPPALTLVHVLSDAAGEIPVDASGRAALQTDTCSNAHRQTSGPGGCHSQ